MTAVCSVGLDMILIQATRPETISAIMADGLAIGVINNKTTATRLIDPGKKAGEKVEFGGSSGLPVMEVRNVGASAVRQFGRIPRPSIAHELSGSQHAA